MRLTAKRLRSTSLAVPLSIALLVGCSQSRDPEDQWFFQPGSEMHFAGLCSEPDNENRYAVQSYAFFEHRNAQGDLQALILGSVELGASLAQPRYSLTVLLESARIKALWPGERFSMQFMIEAQESGATMASDAQETYGASFNAPKEQEVPFEFPEQGAFTWALFGPDAVRWSNPMSIFVADIPDPSVAHRLSLVLTNLQSGEQVTLVGPNLASISSPYPLEEPRRIELSLAETFTPGVKGGLFEYVRTTRRYTDCFAELRTERFRMENMTF